MVFYHKIFPSIKRHEKETNHTTDLESDLERKIRWRSIRIVYFTMFMFSLSMSMSMTGIWPYLNKLDPSAGKEFLGLIVAAGALGQMIFSPIFGYWGNHAKNVRLPLIVSLPIIALTYVGYALLETFPTHTVRYWMLLFRFLTGATTASSVVCRSYVAEATTIRERTGVISMISLNLGLGMMLGQVSQVAVTPLGDEGIPLFGGTLWLNMYTAIAWINVVIQLVIFGVLMWPNMFIEQRIAIREASAKHKESLEKQSKPEVYKLDYIAILSVMIAFFVISISIFEALGASLAMDEFAWSREEALKFMSILMTCGGICNIVVISIIKPLCRRFDERSILIYLGFAVTAVSQYVNITWRGETPQLLLTNGTTTTNSTVLGCPVDRQPWCATAPAMTVTQLVIGYLLTSIGRASSITLCQTIFSKVLGPRPQGVWVGVMMSSSCFARVISPIIITSIYVQLGPVWTFAMTGGILTLCCMWLRLVRARLVPPCAADEGTRHVTPRDEELQKLWTHDNKIQIVATNVEKSSKVFSDLK